MSGSRKPAVRPSQPKAQGRQAISLKREDIDGMDQSSITARLLLEFLLQQQEKDTAGKRFDNIEASVQWAGSAITLPDTPVRMTLDEGKKWLERLERDEQENIEVHEVVEAFPFDGAIAFMMALKQIYGWATPIPPKKWFEAPPTMLSVPISPTERTQIIWGRFAIPGIEGNLMTGSAFENDRPVFTIAGDIRKKYLPAVAEIAELTRKIVRENSIYRGKAIKLMVDGRGNLNLEQAPQFMDVSKATLDELVFSDELMTQVVTNLFTPITHTQMCRDHQVPLKRGILLEGPFGTGKTLCAYVTARLAQDHGWSFITIDRVTALKSALLFAHLYQPCVIFCEDIDRETTGQRTAQLDDILNVVDGIASKSSEVMVVLTSNNVAAINRAMMRPGRLDAVLSIQPPDAKAAEKLMRLYGRDLIAPETSLTEAATLLTGQIPAVIRECVERAKLHAIVHSENGGEFMLGDSDLAHAAKGMKQHLALLHGPEEVPPSDEHVLGSTLTSLIQKGLTADEKRSGSTHDLLTRVCKRLGIA